MTKTDQLLDLMASGSRVTYADIHAATDWTFAQVQKTVHFALISGDIKPDADAYVITSTGVARQKFKPKTSAEKMARTVEKQKIKRESAERQSAASKTETMVQKSVRTNANSVFKLGNLE